MSENSAELLIELLLEDGDTAELDELMQQLRAEIRELEIDSMEQVQLGEAPPGTKGMDMAALGHTAISLAPTLIPPLFDLLKSWIQRKPSTPVTIRVKVGKKTTEIEYDPTKTSAKDLEALIKALNKPRKR